MLMLLPERPIREKSDLRERFTSLDELVFTDRARRGFEESAAIADRAASSSPTQPVVEFVARTALTPIFHSSRGLGRG